MATPTSTRAVAPRRRPKAVELAVVVLLLPLPCLAQALRPAHAADTTNPTDLAILRATGDGVSGKTIRNVCGTVVHPTISYLAPEVAVLVEEDTTGSCSGSNPPSTLTVLLKAGSAWRVSTATNGSGFRLGPVHAGLPEIVVQYPPFQQDCPVLDWNGRDYRFVRSCDGAKGR